MSIKISQGFSRTGSDPIDETFVLSKSEMKSIDDNLMPDVYFAVCKDDGKMYVYGKANEVDDDTGRFRVVDSSSSSGNALIDVTNPIFGQSPSIAEIKRTDSGEYVRFKIPRSGNVELEISDDVNSDLSTTTYLATKQYVDSNIEASKLNYYTKSETDDKITDALSNFDRLDYKIVDALPSTGEQGVRYLVKHPTDNQYEEYIYVNDSWHDIGSTSDVDLSGYYTKTETDDLLSSKQAELVSGESIKTINGESILGEGDIVIESDSKAKYDYTSNISVGGISSGTPIRKDSSLADLVRQMLVTTYYPTYTSPSASLSYSSDALAEVGSTLPPLNATVVYNAGAITLQGTKQNNRGGEATKYYISTSGSDTEYSDESEVSGAFSVPALTRSTKGNLVLTGKVDFSAGPQPKDSNGDDYQSPLPGGSVTSSKTVKFIQAFYYGASNDISVDSFTGLTKLLQDKGDKTVFITTSNQHLTFIYDSSYGDLSSILDSNNFELIDGWSKTTKEIDGFSYNVYVANSATTDSDAKFTFKF